MAFVDGRRALGAAAALTVLLGISEAGAETPAEQADRLFKEATALIAAKRYDVESGRLDPAVGTFYNLGSCLEHERRFVASKRAYDRAAQLAREQNNAQGAARAVEKSARVAAHVGRMDVAVSPKGEASVTLDDAAIALADGPFEVDPGKHVVKVTAKGHKPASRAVDVRDGERVSVELTLESEGLKPSNPPPPPPRSGDGSPSPGGTRWSTLRWVGLGVAGAGVVGLGGGAFFGLRAKGELDEAGCRDGRVCPTQAAAAKLSDAQSSATLSTIFVSAGGALLVGGVVLFVLAPNEPARASRLVVVPIASGDGGGASVLGRF